MVSTQFAAPWNVITPSVYRYEDNKWIDEFFLTGKLRLSTFSEFSKYPCEIRGDKTEGFGICYGEAPDNKSMILAQKQGIRAAILCCSHRLDQKLKKGFNRDSAFEIFNTTNFSFEVARQLSGFNQGLEGSCLYRSNLFINRAINLNFDEYKRPDGTVDMQIINDAASTLGGAELVLLKRKKYEDQQEYRLLWELDYITGGYIDIIVPNARQYCRRINVDEWED